MENPITSVPWPAAASRLRMLAVLALLAFAAPASLHSGPRAAPPTPPRPPASDGRVSLKGEIVDLGCYLMHEGRGDTHIACAQACVKGGAPVGLLAGSVLYVLYAPHETTAPFEEAKRLVGKSAIVTGVVHQRAGLKGLAVTMVAGPRP